MIEKLLKTVQTACELTSSGQRVDAPSHRHLRRLTSAEEGALVVDYREGATLDAVAAKFGIHRVTVASILRRHKEQLRRQGLSSDQVALCSRLYADGSHWCGWRSASAVMPRRCGKLSSGLEYRCDHGIRRPRALRSSARHWLAQFEDCTGNQSAQAPLRHENSRTPPKHTMSSGVSNNTHGALALASCHTPSASFASESGFDGMWM
jgi:hypothetical protein